MILAGRDPIGNNLGEALINALFTEMRLNYCYQFLLHGAIASFAIPYRDMEKALERLELDSSYTILAMGISPHFFDEMDGFGRNDRNEITYRDIKVLEIASNESSFVIMKSRDIPTLSLRALKTEENLELLSEYRQFGYREFDFKSQDGVSNPHCRTHEICKIETGISAGFR